MDLGSRLVKLRKEHSLSQDNLAELVGVSRQAISKWERDETLPDLYNMKKLSEIFKISIDELVNYNYQENLPETNANKLSLILLGIPSFLFAALWLLSFVYIMFNNVVLITGFIRLNNIVVSLSNYIFYPLLFLGHLYIYLYYKLYVRTHLYRTKIASIVLTGVSVLGYLILLAFVYLTGFSAIFLYVVILLMLISGLVGAILIDTSQVATRKKKAQNIYPTIMKYMKWIYAGSIVILTAVIIQNAFLIKNVRYVDEASVTDSVPTDNSFYLYFSDYDTHSLGKFYTRIVLNHKFEQELVGTPTVKIYMDHKLIAEGDMELSYDNQYHFILDEENYKLPLLLETETLGSYSFRNLALRYVITYSYDSTNELTINRDINIVNYDYNSGYTNVWIWQLKEL